MGVVRAGVGDVDFPRGWVSPDVSSREIYAWVSCFSTLFPSFFDGFSDNGNGGGWTCLHGPVMDGLIALPLDSNGPETLGMTLDTRGAVPQAYSRPGPGPGQGLDYPTAPAICI